MASKNHIELHGGPAGYLKHVAKVKEHIAFTKEAKSRACFDMLEGELKEIHDQAAYVAMMRDDYIELTTERNAFLHRYQHEYEEGDIDVCNEALSLWNLIKKAGIVYKEALNVYGAKVGHWINTYREYAVELTEEHDAQLMKLWEKHYFDQGELVRLSSSEIIHR